MFWIPVVVLLSWIGIGTFLLRRESRKAGQDYQREVGRQVYAQADQVEVALRLTPPFQESLTGDRDLVLALDHSSSMGAGPGSPLAEALRSAESFVRRCPRQIHIGLVTFDHDARIDCPITDDHRRVLRALGSTGPGGGTAIDRALDRTREALAGGRPGVAKTVILLSDGGSDPSAAEEAGERLRSVGAEVICVGFGPSAEGDLLTAVAGGAEHYRHVGEQGELIHLFAFLAAAVSGQMAVAGLVDEGVQAPCPFHLVHTGGLYPVGIDPGGNTRIVWSVPLFDADPVALTYRLAPQCPGWHRVATTDARATWRMPDGSVKETQGPRGPYVLVLPDFLTWAWPILNPLFWMLFGRFFCRAAPAHQELPVSIPAALPEPQFPEPLPVSQERPFQAQVQPALVIGLGEVGEWALCHLEHRLRDRGIDDSRIDRVCITVTHRANRPRARVGGVEVADRDRIELHRDLRPYVETLRGSGLVGIRSWIPWRSWLAATNPLATAHTIGGDRRKARLALLLNPSPVEVHLRGAVQRVVDRQGVLLIVAAIGDAEGSGLLAEVAHICATLGGSSTAVLVRRNDDDLVVDQVVALSRELERLIAVRGDGVVSDRQDPPCEARKLFDRLLVLPPTWQQATEAAAGAAELVWSFLAYPDVYRRMPEARREDGEVLGGNVELEAFPLPMLHLWHWVRERTLAQVVNGRWLGLEVVDGSFRLPAVSKELVAGYAAAFWNPVGFVRPQSRLLGPAKAILQGQNAVSTLLDNLPIDALYPEQVTFCRDERRAFVAFCEEWCQYVLEREREKGSWGLPALLGALHQVERDLQTILERIERLSGNEDFRNLTRFASGLLFDLASRFSSLRRGISPWIAALAGEHLELGIGSPTAGSPLCQEIERGRVESEEALLPPTTAVRRLIEQRFGGWFAEYGEAFRTQVGFRISLPVEGRELQIRLQLFEEQLVVSADLPARFRKALDRYRNEVLVWPLADALEEKRGGGIVGEVRVGKPSARVFPRVREAVQEEDPYLAERISARDTPLASALGIAGAEASDPQFAWPEESNARRIAEKIRNSSLRRESHAFSPMLTHLLRDPQRIHAFLADLAHDRIETQDGDCRLLRSGHALPVGKASDGLEPAEALDNLETIARQVVVVGTALDGKPIPEADGFWEVSPEEALEKVERHPLARASQGAPGWGAWRDVIQGLALEVGASNE